MQLSFHPKKNEVRAFKNSSLRFLRIQVCIERIKKEWDIYEKRKTVKIIIENRKTETNFDQN